MHTKSYHQGKKLPTVLLTMLPLFLIAALRYDVGTDYMYTYVPYFRVLSWGKQLRDMEPLFKLINQIVIWLDGHYQWVFVISAGLFLIPVFLQIFNDSPSPLISIFLLYGLTYYFVSLNATRQMVGCAILFYSLRYVKERDWLRFLIAVMIATGFHYSCVLFLPIYIIGNWKIKPRYTIVLSVLLSLCSGAVVNFVLRIIRMTPYGSYIGSQFDIDEGGRIILAIQIVVLILAAWQYRDEEKYRTYFNLHTINTWLAAFAGQIVLIERVRWIFGLSTVILIPMAIKNISDAKLRFLVRLAAMACFTAYVYIVIGLRNSHAVLPYQTIFGR